MTKQIATVGALVGAALLGGSAARAQVKHLQPMRPGQPHGVAPRHPGLPQGKVPLKPMHPGKPHPAPGLTAADRRFLADTMQNGRGEVALSKLAVRKTKNAAVSALAGRIVSDHQQAGNELEQLAKAKSVALPGTMSKRHQGLVARLEKLPAPLFDKNYTDEMIRSHAAAVAAFKKEAAAAKDLQLKAWVSKTLPALEHHLQMARAAQKGRAPLKPMVMKMGVQHLQPMKAHK